MVCVGSFVGRYRNNLPLKMNSCIGIKLGDGPAPAKKFVVIVWSPEKLLNKASSGAPKTKILKSFLNQI